ncbi:hypothetical protein LTS18_014595, partial [Coniosporium uncinatum]
HIAIRQQQLEVFSKTSTLARAVKNQTDRVTVTAQAASALAKRFAEDAPSYASRYTQRAQDGGKETDQHIPRGETVAGQEGQAQPEEGIQQDHHYEQSQENSAVRDPPEGELHPTQEKPNRYPLPDGTIPPEGSNQTPTAGRDTYDRRPQPVPEKEPLSDTQHSNEDGLEPTSSDNSTIPTPKPSSEAQYSSNEAKKLQRESEEQIPKITTAAFSGDQKLAEGHDVDVYYDRVNAQPSTPLSSLPRTKIPKSTEVAQGSDEHVKDGQINADVYYSSEAQSAAQKIPTHEAIPKQDEAEQDINTDVFHSPRIAKMLSGRDKKGYGLGMQTKGAMKTPIDRSATAQGHDQDFFNVRQSGPTASTPPPEPRVAPQSSEPRVSEKEIQGLAADLFNDAGAAGASQVSSSVMIGL